MAKRARTAGGGVLLLALAILGAAAPAAAYSWLEFDGGDALSVPNGASLNPTDAITIEAWCLIPRAFYDLGNCPLLEKGFPSYSNPYYQYHLGINSSTREVLFDLAIAGTRQTLRSPQGALPLGRWVHMAATYDGAAMRLYMDGAQVSQRAMTGALTAYDTELLIGHYYNFDQGIIGRLDGVRLWGVARTQEQIQDRMCTQLRGGEPGLLGCWQFDEGAGQIAADLSPNGNDARLGIQALPDEVDPLWVEGIVPQCLREVAIDVRPGSERNLVHCRGRSLGQVAVAVLSGDGFDATTIDPATVRFGPAGAAPAGRRNAAPIGRGGRDVDGDGSADRVFNFRCGETGIECGDVSATLSGETVDGHVFRGADQITTWSGGFGVATDARGRIVPNPFNPRTAVLFALAEPRTVVVEVFDVRGRHVATLANGEFPAGEHEVAWDGRGPDGSPAPSGQYIFRIEAGEEVQTLRALLLK